MRRDLALLVVAAAGLALTVFLTIGRNDAKSSDSRSKNPNASRSQGVDASTRVARARPWLSQAPQASPDDQLSPHQAELAGPALAVLEEIERHPVLTDNSEVRELVDLERQKIVSSVRGVKQ